MAKHPQDNRMETIFAVAAMRDRAAAIEKVESWLDRGWNPLLPQKPRGRCAGMALIEAGILQTMAGLPISLVGIFGQVELFDVGAAIVRTKEAGVVKCRLIKTRSIHGL